MKELLKTALLWIVIICALPVLFSARKVTAQDEENEPNEPTGKSLPVFTLEGDKTLTVYGFSGNEVTRMDIEEYVYRAVLAEIPGDMEYEALKAQAVAARTYAVRRLLSGEEEVKPGIYAHIACDPEKYQPPLTDREIAALYKGAGEDIPRKARQATADTRGEILVCGGSPIIAAFHTACGGMTESGGNVWGTSLPYLSPVESKGDMQSEYFGAEHIFTHKEITARITAYFGSVAGGAGEYEGVTILSQTPSGSVLKLTVCGREMSGEKFAEIFSLPCPAFTSSEKEGSTIIITQGCGHMAGMSMYGADCMAKDGADYREILLHYYTGIEIGTVG